MKKVFVSMMLAGTLLAGSSAFAQSPTDGNSGASTQKECTECPTDGSQAKKGPKDHKGPKGQKGGKKGHKGPKANKGPKFNPFEGVQLSDDQQQRLQVLQQGLGPVVLTPEQQAQIKENPTLTKEQKKQLKEERKTQKLENKKKYLNGVKEILTPDQYVIFLENCYIKAPAQQQAPAKQ